MVIHFRYLTCRRHVTMQTNPLSLPVVVFYGFLLMSTLSHIVIPPSPSTRTFGTRKLGWYIVSREGECLSCRERSCSYVSTIFVTNTPRAYKRLACRDFAISGSMRLYIASSYRKRERILARCVYP